jgi:ABC-type phosphate transport system substrate-binding protein
MTILPRRAGLSGRVGGVSLMIAVTAVVMAVVAPAEPRSDDAYVVIVNQQNPVTTLPRSQLDAIFLGKVTMWPSGLEIAPVSNADDDLRESFCAAVHSRPYAAVAAYWAAKTFKEAVLPPGRLDDTEVLHFVAVTPGGIGFVRAGTPLEGVKAVQVDG